MTDQERRLFAVPLQRGEFERHEVLHMLASVVSADVYSTLHDNQPPNAARTGAALAALPASWDQQREDIPAERHANRAERRAAQRKHHH